MKESEWQPKTSKPAHNGVYKTARLPHDSLLYQHWNGLFWSYYSVTPYSANKNAGKKSVRQDIMWKGVINE